MTHDTITTALLAQNPDAVLWPMTPEAAEDARAQVAAGRLVVVSAEANQGRGTYARPDRVDPMPPPGGTSEIVVKVDGGVVV